MDKFIPLSKQSKAAQKKFYKAQRGSWHGLPPVTRSVPSGKGYNRAKAKQAARSGRADIE